MTEKAKKRELKFKKWIFYVQTDGIEECNIWVIVGAGRQAITYISLYMSRAYTYPNMGAHSPVAD